MKNKIIKAVIKANKKVYNYLYKKASLKDLKFSNKTGYGGDNSLIIDLKAEKIFIKCLSSLGNIYSEECGKINNKSKYTFIIDPIDGSNNISSNLPYYGTSVAVKKNGKLVAGFVCNLVDSIITYRIFNSNVKYYSILQKKNIKKEIINNKKLAIFEKSYENLNLCKKFYKKGIKIRSLGASALSLCDSRNYKFVLLWGKLRDFDILASIYICKDLNILKTKKFLLISENNEIFHEIKETIKE